MIGWVIGFFIVFMVLGSLAVRLAPTDPERWHVPVTAEADKDMTGGAIRVIAGDRGTLERLDAIARATDRTEVVAGSVAAGRITYRTRSFWIGFPDFTTVDLVDGQVRLLARLRFGRSDLGVNARRLEGWLAQL